MDSRSVPGRIRPVVTAFKNVQQVVLRYVFVLRSGTQDAYRVQVSTGGGVTGDERVCLGYVECGRGFEQFR